MPQMFGWNHTFHRVSHYNLAVSYRFYFRSSQILRHLDDFGGSHWCHGYHQQLQTAGFLMDFWNFMHAVAVTDMRFFYARQNLRSNEIQIDSGGMISSRTQTKQRISMNFLHSYRNQDILWMEERTLIPTGRLYVAF